MNANSLNSTITDFIKKDFISLLKDITVKEALDNIRESKINVGVIYFYVVDEENKLVGVIPTRKLLSSSLESRIEDLMIKNVISLKADSTVYIACEFFILYKFLAMPVTDNENKIIGIVDITLFTNEMLDIAEKKQINDIFETIGFRLNEVKNASSLQAFKIRIPWLMATISSGLLCAYLTGLFQTTLQESILIAFFLTLLLGLNESVSIQSMTIAIQMMHTIEPSFKWYVKKMIKESSTAILLGLCCGLIVSIFVLLWKSNLIIAFAIGFSIFLSLILAALFGLSVPVLLHAFKLDPKISSGPLTLALTDIMAILIYFTVATLFL